MSRVTYRLSNTWGLTGGVWSVVYTSHRAARAALRAALGWERIYLSEPFRTDHGSAQCAYLWRRECTADQEGAFAPRITREA